MLPLPEQFRNPINLADWLELNALGAEDKNSSAGEIVDVLQFHIQGREIVEEYALSTMGEIEDRQTAAQDAYPFELVNGRTIQAKQNWKECAAYIFCLCLSYFGWKLVRNAPINPWFLFEDLSAIAARNYFGGDVIQFGNRVVKKAFADRINELCESIGEGQGFEDQDLRSVKDDRVDLVIWKDFVDQKSSKLLVFGQCASGANWLDKQTELRPDAFWRQWIRGSWVSELQRSFFIPHRIDHLDWDRRARNTGLLFDRCRVSHWAFQENNLVLSETDYMEWCNSASEGYQIA